MKRLITRRNTFLNSHKIVQIISKVRCIAASSSRDRLCLDPRANHRAFTKNIKDKEIPRRQQCITQPLPDKHTLNYFQILGISFFFANFNYLQVGSGVSKCWEINHRPSRNTEQYLNGEWGFQRYELCCLSQRLKTGLELQLGCWVWSEVTRLCSPYSPEC